MGLRRLLVAAGNPRGGVLPRGAGMGVAVPVTEGGDCHHQYPGMFTS